MFIFYMIFKLIADQVLTWWLSFKFGKIYNKAYVEDQLGDVVVAVKLLKKPDDYLKICFSEHGEAEIEYKCIKYFVGLARWFSICIDMKGNLFVCGFGNHDVYIKELYGERSRMIGDGDLYKGCVIDVQSLDEAIDIIRELNLHILQNN